MQIRRQAFDTLCIITFTLLFVNFKINQAIDSGNTSNLNPFYLLLPIILILLPKYKSQINNYPTLLFSAFSISNIIATFRFGFSFESIRILIAALSFFVGFSLAKSNSADKISNYFNTTGVIVIAIISARFLIYPLASLQLLLGNRNFLLDYPSITTGGHNIEVTYLVFLAVLCGNKRITFAILTLTATLSIMYMSRVGLILIFLIASMAIYKKLNKINFVIIFTILVLAVPALLSTATPKVYERFTNIQQEMDYGEEGVGRLGLLNGATALIQRNLLGYGVGNSIKSMEEITGLTYRENNVHNIYLQILLDLGVVPFCLFFVFSIWLIFHAVKTRFRNQYVKLSAAYFLIGFIQFTGFDALGWLCVGLAYPHLKFRNIKHCTSASGI